MRTYLECIPCFLRAAVSVGRTMSDDVAVHERVVRKVLRLASEMSFEQSPPEMSRLIHEVLRKETGDVDPYRAAKREANTYALKLLPAFRKLVINASDPFALATRLAIAGNVIDLGTRPEISEDEIATSLEQAINDPLSLDAVDSFRAAVTNAQRIFYLADNAGEIVLDRLLLEQLPLERVTVAVRGRPVINDATLEDARAVGLHEITRVIDNGSDAPGTVLSLCSTEFRREFEESDLIIAKGQGNFETLCDTDFNIFFLFQAKCPVIAREAGCKLGQAVLMENITRRNETTAKTAER